MHTVLCFPWLRHGSFCYLTFRVSAAQLRDNKRVDCQRTKAKRFPRLTLLSGPINERELVFEARARHGVSHELRIGDLIAVVVVFAFANVQA